MSIVHARVRNIAARAKKQACAAILKHHVISSRRRPAKQLPHHLLGVWAAKRSKKKVTLPKLNLPDEAGT